MTGHVPPLQLPGAWHFLGIAGAIIFYSRFYVQWIVSEREGQSTLPEIFWHLSTAGSLALLVYAIATRSPLGALGQCFNIVVYARNILHLWRKRFEVAPSVNLMVHGFVGAIVIVSVGFLLSIWAGELQTNRAAPPEIARQVWLWLALGLVGQLLFAGRFLIQWIATERKGECTVPRIFWQLSIVATVLQAACFLQRGEWVFAVGSSAVMFVYFRNLSLFNVNALETLVDS